VKTTSPTDPAAPRCIGLLETIEDGIATLTFNRPDQVQTGRTEDHREAARAFVEKRVPIFTGH
jgi:hypothetical protein